MPALAAPSVLLAMAVRAEELAVECGSVAVITAVVEL
jgi:hypothetical protein